jgi:pimeloyl-ACP methyl ester carboxylesterase
MDFIFHHGGGQGGWVWDETISALKSQAPGAHRYLVLDVPGCGAKRDRDTSRVSFHDIVSESMNEIEASGMSDIILVGHSQAGTVMPALFERRSDLFKRLIYLSCIAPEPGENATSVAEKVHSNGKGPLENVFNNPNVPLIEQSRQMFCNDMTSEQTQTFLGNLLKDQWPATSRHNYDWRYEHLVDAPTSYVICLRDMILTPEAQMGFALRLHADRITRIDAGHQAQNTRPHGLAEILLLESVG